MEKGGERNLLDSGLLFIYSFKYLIALLKNDFLIIYWEVI